MYTYTTPTITCTLEGVDFSLVNYVRIAIGEGKKVIVRTVEPSEITDNTATIKLTQEETAELGGGMVTIQARVLYLDGTVQATNRVQKPMSEVIDKVVI